MAFSDLQDVLLAFKRGEMVIILDDDTRENEGDLIVSAALMTESQMAFMVRHTSGIVCAPLQKSLAQHLSLSPMVQHNNAPLSTAFTVSIDAKEGLTTGISAAERLKTVQTLAKEGVLESDFVRPGHVFPLIAQDGGVLMRSGHTEAAVDLCVLTGLPPVGVICELVNDDGSVKRGAELHDFAAEHHLKMTTVADLIAYREKRERLVQLQDAQNILLPIGSAQARQYQTPFDACTHFAIVYGDIHHCADGVPVRFMRADLLKDVFGDRTGFDRVFLEFERCGAGVLVYLQTGGAGVPFSHQGMLSNRGHAVGGASQSWREIGLGAQILQDIGVKNLRLISSQPRHYVGLDGFGLSIVDEVLL